MMPKPKMDALLNAPPKKVSRRPSKPPVSPCNWEGSTPGNTMNDPNRKMRIYHKVLRIRVRRSSMEKMFFMVLMNFFML
jgi:hypothetical protein